MPRRLGSHGALLALGALVVVSTVARVVLSRGVDAPWIAPDEHLYGLVGRSLVNGDGFTIVGEPVPFYSFLYPLFVGLAQLGTSAATGLTVAQVAQALVMSATAIPVFLWARPLAGARLALFAATLTVLIPGLAYSALLMSEALYYPVAVVAVWALAACLRDPTLSRQLLFVAALGVAVATRLQAVGFVAALVVALAILAVAERSLAPFRRVQVSLVVLAAGGTAWLVWRLASGGREALGAYATLAEAEEYSIGDLASSIAWQTGAVVILTVGVPLVALGVLAWETLRGHEQDAGVRALVAAALAYFVCHGRRGRLLRLSLHRAHHRAAAALGRAAGVRRVRRLARTRDAASAAVHLDRGDRRRCLGAPPPGRAHHDAGRGRRRALDRPARVPAPRGLGGDVRDRLRPRRGCRPPLRRARAPAREADRRGRRRHRARRGLARRVSRDARALAVRPLHALRGCAPSWLDESGANGVAYLVTGDRIWPSVWHQMFWNRSITSVVRLRTARSPGVVPQRVVTPTRRTACSSTRTERRSTRRSSSRRRPCSSPASRWPRSRRSTEPGMTLWNVESPVRVLQRVRGLQPNGDLYGGSSARIEVFACGPGELQLTLLGKQGVATRIRLDGELARRACDPAGDGVAAGRVGPADADGSGRCVYELESDGLVGSTRIEFVRTG